MTHVHLTFVFWLRRERREEEQLWVKEEGNLYFAGGRKKQWNQAERCEEKVFKAVCYR